jgi:glycosyltransferase involved in cell wall biosynthesis
MGNKNKERALTSAGVFGKPPQKIAFVYAGRRGSNLECSIALSEIARGLGFHSRLVLSSDNERLLLARKFYPSAESVNFLSPSQVFTLKAELEHGISFFTMLSPKMAPIFTLLPSPKIFYFHATYEYAYSKRSPKDVFYEFLHDTLIRSSTITAATQPGLAHQIKKRLGVKAKVLPHPPYSPIKPGFFSGTTAVKLPFRKGGYFLNFGEISRRSKGTWLLLEALRGTSVPLVLAGKLDGVPRAGSIFHLNRWVDDAELHWLVKNCRAVVLPYLLRSQFSGCLALAFHFKKPVLAPSTEAFAGWVEDGKTGWLFRHGDAKSLREKMQWIMREKPRISRSMIAAKEKERERATAEALTGLLRALPPANSKSKGFTK